MFLRYAVLVMVLTLMGAPFLMAQKVLGPGSPGTGGIVPTLSAPQAWMGNAGFGISIEGGVGSATGLLVISPDAVNINLSVPIYVDLTTAIQPFIPITLSGPSGVAGAGSFFLPLSLAGLNNPALAGLSFTFQAAIFDPSVLAVTNGLTVELTMPPEIFVGTSVGGSVDPFAFIDPLTASITASGGRSETNNVNGSAFTDAGRTLYVLSGFGALSKADVTLAAPAWSPVTTFVGASGVAEGNLQIDACRKLMWTFVDSGSGPELHAMDIDPASPTYETIVHQTTNVATNLVGTWALSPSGTKIVIPSLLGGAIRVWDTDPSSPSFLQNIDLFQPPIPFPLQSSTIPTSTAGSLWINTQVAFSPDEDLIFVLRQGTGPTPSEIATYSFSQQGWIDYDSNTSVIDNIGQFANPPVAFGSAPTSLAMGPNAEFLWVSGFGGSGFAGRVDNPSIAGAVSFSPMVGIDLTDAWRAKINPDANLIAMGSGSPFAIRFIDPITISVVGTVATPNLSGGTTIAWR